MKQRFVIISEYLKLTLKSEFKVALIKPKNIYCTLLLSINIKISFVRTKIFPLFFTKQSNYKFNFDIQDLFVLKLIKCILKQNIFVICIYYPQVTL